MVVNLLLEEPSDKGDVVSVDGKQWASLLNQLGSVIWPVMTRSEARLWLCEAVSGITCVSPQQQWRVFLDLLRPKRHRLASQLLQMIFEKRPRLVGPVIAKRSHALDKFFHGHTNRIMQWFSMFGGSGGGGGGLEQKKGAKALSHFAFANRDICWEELVWNGKHGQSPAVVALKPHYLLDLDIERTVENFIENVPEFWSSSEFADSLRDGEIVSVETKFFVEFFDRLMYKEDASDVWDVVEVYLTEESFAMLCHHLLIALDEHEFCTFLELLSNSVNWRMEPNDCERPLYWLDFVLMKSRADESIDELLLLNAVVNKGRQVLHLVNDEEYQEELAKAKDIVAQISEISGRANNLDLLNECFKMNIIEAVKCLGLQSWVLQYLLSEECPRPELWETVFSSNGISFRKSDRYSILYDDGALVENESDSDDRIQTKRKRKKKRKSKKRKRRGYSDDDNHDNVLLDLDISNDMSTPKPKEVSWLLGTDGFSVSWSTVDLPEHLSKFCFSTWMKWFSRTWSAVA